MALQVGYGELLFEWEFKEYQIQQPNPIHITIHPKALIPNINPSNEITFFVVVFYYLPTNTQ